MQTQWSLGALMDYYRLTSPVKTKHFQSQLSGTWLSSALDMMNTGVFVIHPNEHEFQKHLKTLHSDPKWADNHKTRWADNSYLPAVYKNEWYVLPAEYNTFAEFFNTPTWDKVTYNLRIIHFPGPNKPWDCPERLRKLC
eukprot:449484_1